MVAHPSLKHLGEHLKDFLPGTSELISKVLETDEVDIAFNPINSLNGFIFSRLKDKVETSQPHAGKTASTAF